MSFFERLEKCLKCFLRYFCLPLHQLIFSEYREYRLLKNILAFTTGFGLGQLYYYYLIKDIPFMRDIGYIVCLIVSIFLGISNVVFIQVRCILCLLLPMYSGKAGRGVLKAVVLTYVVAGPITNMGLNAKEVVRVFACSKELSYNLSKIRHNQIYRPMNKALGNLKKEVDHIKGTMSSIHEVIYPVEYEIEGSSDLDLMKAEIKLTDPLFKYNNKMNKIRNKFSTHQETENKRNRAKYVKKMIYRCENQLSRAISMCSKVFTPVYDACTNSVPSSAVVICWPLMLPGICDVKKLMKNICDCRRQIDPGLGEGYAYLKKARRDLTNNLSDIHLQIKLTNVRQLYNIQDAKETGNRVLHAFKEKYIAMSWVSVIVNFCFALLFLRIVVAAQFYHDFYLTDIDFDNVYITGYFKKIDRKREKNSKLHLLPLNKMERNKYIEVYSAAYMREERSKLFTLILKVMLEGITATTFVMLDRLFFEALDVVKRHAIVTYASDAQDIEIKVEGAGVLSSMMTKILKEFISNGTVHMIYKDICIPRPRSIPTIYYVKIYGGYLWILLLLYFNAYILRLRRLICSYFYPSYEKKRILHLYNDILKKRMKIQKTLRRKAVQAVRAHYLSGENLLSLRMRYPNLLGWLSAFPAARMKCLICEETEPRKCDRLKPGWRSCSNRLCPFVLCEECVSEAGGCLACDPALALLSDVDSLSDEAPRRY